MLQGDELMIIANALHTYQNAYSLAILFARLVAVA